MLQSLLKLFILSCKCLILIQKLHILCMDILKVLLCSSFVAASLICLTSENFNLSLLIAQQIL